MSIKRFVLLLEAWCNAHGYHSSHVGVCSLSTTWRGGRMVYEVLLREGKDRQELVSFEDEE